MPMTRIALLYSCSDKAIAKWCVKLDVEFPGRGYWNKWHAGKIDPVLHHMTLELLEMDVEECEPGWDVSSNVGTL